MTNEYLPELTVRYKTYVKNSLVDALNQVFFDHPDPLLQNTKTSVAYSKEEIDYPRVLVRFYERELFNSGVGHEEIIYIQGESDSIKLPVDLLGGSVQLTWEKVPDAIGYWVYRTQPNGVTVAFFTVPPSFEDVGARGDPKALPTQVTANLEVPQPEAVAGPQGSLGSGTYYYNVTAIGRREAVKFGHYFYSADIEFAIYALSSLDRDYIADTVVQTIAMGKFEDYTNRLHERLYPTQDLFPDSYLNFINLNTDRIQGFGETETSAPWGAEDDLLYQTSYRVGVFGEIYSLPPKITWALIQKITQYPYVENLDPVPTGNPNDDAPWESNVWPL